jgi:hypothetical protein
MNHTEFTCYDGMILYHECRHSIKWLSEEYQRNFPIKRSYGMKIRFERRSENIGICTLFFNTQTKISIRYVNTMQYC